MYWAEEYHFKISWDTDAVSPHGHHSPRSPLLRADPGNLTLVFLPPLLFLFLSCLSLLLPLVYSFYTLLRVRVGTLRGAQGASISWEMELAGLSHSYRALGVTHLLFYKVLLLPMGEMHLLPRCTLKQSRLGTR